MSNTRTESLSDSSNQLIHPPGGSSRLRRRSQSPRRPKHSQRLREHPKPNIPKVKTEQNDQEFKPTLEIVQQPPSKAIYCRNLRPFPKVKIDEPIQSNNRVVVSVCRCDNMAPDPNLLRGPKRMKIPSSGEIVFNKLKITRTSIQEGDTHFILRFDIIEWCYDGSEMLVSSTYSAPIQVFSHSSQLRKNHVPQIIEVIPSSGKPGERVAILGNNFYPGQWVQFGDVLLQPEFKSEGTLVCNVPFKFPFDTLFNEELFGSQNYTEIMSNISEDPSVEIRVRHNGFMSQTHGTFHYHNFNLLLLSNE